MNKQEQIENLKSQLVQAMTEIREVSVKMNDILQLLDNMNETISKMEVLVDEGNPIDTYQAALLQLSSLEAHNGKTTSKVNSDYAEAVAKGWISVEEKKRGFHQYFEYRTTAKGLRELLHATQSAQVIGEANTQLGDADTIGVPEAQSVRS